VKVDSKSNQITAILELIKVLELNGCMVTINAIRCQKEIVKLITEKNADYVISLKKNQGTLYESVEQLFKLGISTGFQESQHSTYKTEETEHGPHEIRKYMILSAIRFNLDPDSVWSNIKSIGMVESVPQVDGKTRVETRYFISDVEDNAKQSANSVRSH
jgi:predicted transposase YbfD/YdcC